MNDLASRLRSHPEGDLSLAAGGVALAIGSFLAFARMEASWAAFPLLLVLALPCAVLFALGLSPGAGGGQIGTRPDGRLAPWQTAFLLFALALLAASIIQLTEVLGKENPGTGTATWVFVLTGLCALSISARGQSAGTTLVAALFFGAAALTAIDWIDSDAPVAAYRDVLLIEGVLFLLVVRGLWDARRSDAKSLVGVSGAALIAGSLLGSDVQAGTIFGLETEVEGDDGWELVLIIVSIGLLAFAAWQQHGGTAFVGGSGVVSFLVLTGEGDLSGWPLVLVIVALACLAWALAVRPSRQPPGAGAMPHAPQPPPQAQSPPE